MTKLSESERVLQDKLKQCCDHRGKEIDPRQSAAVLHQIGLLYRTKSPDKIKLVQSAGLLNAAILRHPSNHVYLNDLRELCFHVLKLAKAAQTNADLVCVSDAVSEMVKELRMKVNSHLFSIHPIPYKRLSDELKKLENEKIYAIKKIQLETSDGYADIMHFIGSKCNEIIGKAPCKFCLVGMGSLARREITPYSDFEHVIILEEGVQHRSNYEEILEHFRWYAVVFLFIMVNLKETILRFLAIPCLNDPTQQGGDWFYDAHTPCGMCPDGFSPAASKTPLGRTQPTKYKPWTVELIQPISKMVHFLDKTEALKNGYHLADMLTKTCYVFGDRDCYDDFEKEVVEKMSEYRDFIFTDVTKQLNAYLENFKPEIALAVANSRNTCDIKRAVYRTITLYVSALARRYLVQERSCFDIVVALERKSLIDECTAHYLLYAVAIACEVRLKAYMTQKGQDDIMGFDYAFDDVSDHSSVTNLLISLVGEKSMLDYFAVVLYLHDTLDSDSMLCVIKENLYDRLSMKFRMLLDFNRHERIIDEWQLYNVKKRLGLSVAFSEEFSIRFFVASSYQCRIMYEEALETLMWLYEHPVETSSKNALVQLNVGVCLRRLGKYREALPYLEEAKINFERSTEETKVSSDGNLCYVAETYADCKYRLEEYQEALRSYRTVQRYHSKSRNMVNFHRKRLELFGIAKCLLYTGHPGLAVRKLEEVMDFLCRHTFQLTPKYHTLLCMCYFSKGKYQRAFDSLRTAYKIEFFMVPAEIQEADDNNRVKTIARQLLTDLEEKPDGDLKGELFGWWYRTLYSLPKVRTTSEPAACSSIKT